MKRHKPTFNHLLSLTLIFFISGCTDTVTNDKQEVIIELFNKQITQNDIKAKPPTPDELKNYIFTPFHVELLNLIHETTLKNAIKYWKVSPSDEEILRNEKVYFDAFPVDRNYIKFVTTKIEPMVKAYKLYLAGSSIEEIHKKLKGILPYQLENWQALLPNKEYVAKSLASNESMLTFNKDLLKKSDTEIKEYHIKFTLKVIKKDYQYMLLGKAICDDNKIPLEKASVPITLGEQCITYAAVWLSYYFHNNTDKPSPATSESILALDFASYLVVQERMRNSILQQVKEVKEMRGKHAH